MAYTCEIRTDYIDPSKTEEILKNLTNIISEANRRESEERAKDVKQD